MAAKILSYKKYFYRVVEMNLLDANIGHVQGTVPNMRRLWYIIVENPVDLVVIDQVRFDKK